MSKHFAKGCSEYYSTGDIWASYFSGAHVINESLLLTFEPHLGLKKLEVNRNLILLLFSYLMLSFFISLSLWPFIITRAARATGPLCQPFHFLMIKLFFSPFLTHLRSQTTVNWILVLLRSNKKTPGKPRKCAQQCLTLQW